MKGRRKTYVLIDRGGFGNKGAELMLNAVLEKLRESDALYVPAIGHINGEMSPEEQQRLGLSEAYMPKRNYQYTKTVMRRNKLPQFLLDYIGKVSLQRVHVVFDIGGFRFGDQWNSRYEKQDRRLMEEHYRKLKANGSKIIFLPQAFGPFETDAGRDWFLSAVKYADLIYAREPVSLAHVRSVLGDDTRVRLSPDFTNLCLGELPEECKKYRGKVCLIPNSKMISHSGEGAAYLDFLVALARQVQESGQELFLMNHEGPEDFKLCEQLNQQLGSNIPIVNDLNAQEVKGVIGVSSLVISSRYHGVVSALSQGVPCLCTSWSHKYPLLLDEYECADALLFSDQREAAFSMLSKYMDPAVNAEVRARLTACSSRIKILAEEMWVEVFGAI